MYVVENSHKLLFVVLLFAGYAVAASLFLQQGELATTEQSLAQMSDESGHITEQLRRKHTFENNGYALGWLAVGVVAFLVFLDDLRKLFKRPTAALLMASVFLLSGCWRPFEPVKLEVVAPNEEAFLLPYLGDGKKQESSNNEEYLKANLVYTKQVEEFFKLRGITITNLGISGGFIYKDKSILDTMVKVFNAEQEKSVAAAESAAQEERNKTVILEATGKADALLKTKKAEADGIKLVADAKMYELQKAGEELQAYVSLKQLELQKELLLKWDGAYPKYFIGGGTGTSPGMLLQLPPLETGTTAKTSSTTVSQQSLRTPMSR